MGWTPTDSSTLRLLVLLVQTKASHVKERQSKADDFHVFTGDLVVVALASLPVTRATRKF